MKRISMQEIKRKRVWTWCIFSLIVSFALFVSLLPVLFPQPEYNDLKSKEITVDQFLRYHRYRAGYAHLMYTSDGERYYVTGDFKFSELESVPSGTKATMKWSENPFCWFSDHAEEIIIDGKVVVSYNNDEPVLYGLYVVLGASIALLAGLFLWFGLGWIQHLQIKQSKRDRRIEKKYGKKK